MTFLNLAVTSVTLLSLTQRNAGRKSTRLTHLSMAHDGLGLWPHNKHGTRRVMQYSLGNAA